LHDLLPRARGRMRFSHGVFDPAEV